MTQSEKNAPHQVNLSELVTGEGQLHVLLTSRAQMPDKKSMSCRIRMGDRFVPLDYASAQAVGEIKLTLQPLKDGQELKHISLTATPQGQWKMTITQEGKPPIENTVWLVNDIPLCCDRVNTAEPLGKYRVVPCRVVATEIISPASSPPPPRVEVARDAHVPNIWRRSGSGAGR